MIWGIGRAIDTGMDFGVLHRGQRLPTGTSRWSWVLLSIVVGQFWLFTPVASQLASDGMACLLQRWMEDPSSMDQGSRLMGQAIEIGGVQPSCVWLT